MVGPAPIGNPLTDIAASGFWKAEELPLIDTPPDVVPAPDDAPPPLPEEPDIKDAAMMCKKVNWVTLAEGRKAPTRHTG